MELRSDSGGGRQRECELCGPTAECVSASVEKGLDDQLWRMTSAGSDWPLWGLLSMQCQTLGRGSGHAPHQENRLSSSS